jgi:hypothetical protein
MAYATPRSIQRRHQPARTRGKMRRFDRTSLTVTPIKPRIAKRRARAKIAKASRRRNR